MEKGIRLREELLIFAKDQKEIAEFIVNHRSKVVTEVINMAWEMECAKQKMLIGRSQGSAVKPLFSTLSRKYLQHFQILHQVRLPYDFRWSQAIIPWHDLMLLLEGQLVHPPAPKTHFAKDICFACDTPIFATGKNPICFVKNGSIDDCETEMMMAVRWKIFCFNCQILEAQQKEAESCPKCFANLILSQ